MCGFVGFVDKAPNKKKIICPIDVDDLCCMRIDTDVVYEI